MAQARNAARTRHNIVRAAQAEFSAKGYAGARMQGIAQRAGVNKELLYHYFASKEALFAEIRDTKIAAGLRRDPTVAADANDIIVDRFKRVLDDMEWVRLITWEAAQGGERDLPREAERGRTIADYVRSIRKAQQSGRLPADLDARLLQLAIFALTTYPLAFSQITRLTTGHSASDPKFQRQWSKFLRLLGTKIMTAGARGNSPRKTMDEREKNGHANRA